MIRRVDGGEECRSHAWRIRGKMDKQQKPSYVLFIPPTADPLYLKKSVTKNLKEVPTILEKKVGPSVTES